jgi:hypothetical protein
MGAMLADKTAMDDAEWVRLAIAYAKLTESDDTAASDVAEMDATAIATHLCQYGGHVAQELPQEGQVALLSAILQVTGWTCDQVSELLPLCIPT